MSRTYAANAMADKIAGLTAAFAIAAALRKHELDGSGAVIEVPMAELLASFGLVEHLWGRTFVPPLGDARYPRVSSPARRPFPTADGHLAAVVYTDRDWERFFAMIGRPELADDPRYATLYDRTERLEELYTLVADHLAGGTTAEWFARFTEAGIPSVPYNRVDDLFDDPHFRRRRSARGDRPSVRGPPVAVPDAGHVRRRRGRTPDPLPCSAPTPTRCSARCDEPPTDHRARAAPLIAAGIGLTVRSPLAATGRSARSRRGSLARGR